MGIANFPPDTKFRFIWSGRIIRVQYGRDVPSVSNCLHRWMYRVRHHSRLVLRLS
jgi:hypothetical protein